MEKDYLVLKRASASRPPGEWNDDDYDVLAEGVVIGSIRKAAAAPAGQPWLWTLASRRAFIDSHSEIRSAKPPPGVATCISTASCV